MLSCLKNDTAIRDYITAKACSFDKGTDIYTASVVKKKKKQGILHVIFMTVRMYLFLRSALRNKDSILNFSFRDKITIQLYFISHSFIYYSYKTLYCLCSCKNVFYGNQQLFEIS